MRPVVDLTAAQQRILDAIVIFVRTKGYPPTLKELQGVCRYKSPNAVQSHIEALVRKGRIERDKGVARGIRLLDNHTALGTASA